MKPSARSWTVQEQLDKNERLKLSDVNELQAWMKGEQHLPSIPDEQVVLFHHACDYQIDKTKETIERCYTLRTTIKEIFYNRDPSHKYIQEINKVLSCTPLPGFDKDGNQVIWVKFLDTDPEKYYLGAAFKQALMVMDVVQLQYGPVPGYVFILDGKGYSLSHVLRSSLSLYRKFVEYAQEGSTFFPKAIHLLNASTVIEKSLLLVKPFIKSELFSVIKFHKPGKLDTLLQCLPEDVIPDEYGGKAGSLITIHEKFYNHLLEYADWFKEEEKWRVDESKRRNGKAISKNQKSERSSTSEDSTEQLSLRTLAID
ncbi:retinol-binding protein pinta-like [Lycorma delicatula]|uniref:retinol-binding protein pinta-like n=1 Tax=Lycorma delicatula TaxID=130591 RepID=UPI003F515849